MKAMIFAAGLGTRLKPLTDSKPKALISFKGIPLLQIIIAKLKIAGFNNIVINVHHFASQIIEFLAINNNFGVNIQISDEQDLLLDTGGGLKKASTIFNNHESVLIHNVDVISNIDLLALYKHHQQAGNLATLAVKHRETARFLLIDEKQNLCGRLNTKTKQEQIINQGFIDKVAFSGIQVISPKLIDLMTENGAFSIIDFYLRIAANYSIGCFLHDNNYWYDLGDYQKFKQIEKDFSF